MLLDPVAPTSEALLLMEMVRSRWTGRAAIVHPPAPTPEFLVIVSAEVLPYNQKTEGFPILGLDRRARQSG